MDSINTILGDKDFKEPEEIQKLKVYIWDLYGSRPEIRMSPKGLVVVVDSSGLANALRLHLPELKRRLSLNQNIAIRIR